MDENTSYIAIVCLAGLLGLGIIFGLAARADAPSRQQWHQLASQLGLRAETFFRIGRIRLYGTFQRRNVTVEQYWTPDPQDPQDVEKGVEWVRILLATHNPHQAAFMFGKLDVLNYAAGKFAKQFKAATSATLIDPEIPQTFFVIAPSRHILQSLLERNSEIKHALVAVNAPYFIQLAGSQLRYTELDSELMDRADIDKSVERLKLTLSLMHAIAQHVETPHPPGGPALVA